MASTLAQKIIAAHARDAESGVAGPVAVVPDRIVLDEESARAAVERLEPLPPPAFPAERLVLLCSAFPPLRHGVLGAGGLAALAARLDHARCIGPGRGGAANVALLDEGLVRPGGLVLSGALCLEDAGAVGALAVRADGVRLAQALRAGDFPMAAPESVRVRLAGEVGRWAGGRDLALFLLKQIGQAALLDRVAEVTGPPLERLAMNERLAFASLASHVRGEDGATTSFLLAADDAVLAWLRARTAARLEPLLADSQATYAAEFELDVSGLEPLVAEARTPGAARRISELPELEIDQVVLGGSSGGRVEDLRLAAHLLKEHPVHPEVRLVVVPGSQRAFLHAAEEGSLAILIRAGAVVAAPTSGLWREPRTLEPGEACLATSLGIADPAPPGTTLYLSGVPVAVATAVMGRIAHPDEVLRRRREPV